MSTGDKIFLFVFVLLILAGGVLAGIGAHEKAKHKDDKTPPGKTYDIMLYVGIALLVIGIIGLIWKVFTIKGKSSSKPNADMDMSGMELPTRGGYMNNDGSNMMDSSGYGQDFDVNVSSMSQMAQPQMAQPQSERFIVLQDGRLIDRVTGTVFSSSQQQMTAPQQSSPVSKKEDKFTLEDLVKSASMLDTIKHLFRGN